MKTFSRVLVLAVVVVAGWFGYQSCSKKQHDAQTTEALSYIPADSDAVFVLDVERMREGAVGRKLTEDFAHDLELRAFKRTCGFDPVTQIDRLAIGAHLDHESSGVFVMTGRDLGKLVDCADELGTRVRREDGIVYVTDKDGTAALRLVDSHTLVGVYGDHPTKAMVDLVLEHDDSIRDRAPFASLYRDVDTARSAWFIVRGGALRGLAGPHDPVGVFGTFDIDDDMKFEVRLRFDGGSDARDALRDFGHPPRIDGLDLTVDRDGSDIVVKANVSPKMVAKFVKQRLGE